MYLGGLVVGLEIAIYGMAISVVLGVFGAIARRSTNVVIRGIASVYVAVFRAIPPLVLLYIVYFGLPSWAADSGVTWAQNLFEPLNNRIFAAVIALGVNSGAYSTEIIRAAINAVGEEQMEAARSIGMSYAMAMRRTILPQAARIAFPPLGNEFITDLKGTSLASVIGVVELMRQAQMAAASTFENLLAYSLAGVYYVIVVAILQILLSRIETWFPGTTRSRHPFLFRRPIAPLGISGGTTDGPSQH